MADMNQDTPSATGPSSANHDTAINVIATQINNNAAPSCRTKSSRSSSGRMERITAPSMLANQPHARLSPRPIAAKDRTTGPRLVPDFRVPLLRVLEVRRLEEELDLDFREADFPEERLVAARDAMARL